MSMGRREERQAPMWLAGTELARSPGHRFYEKLNELLSEATFDTRVEQLCTPYFEADDKPGRPSIPPGVYFRMLFIGYFEGIESERGLEWRCADSLSLRTFLGVQVQERVPDHSSLSRMRTRLDGAVYDEVFRLVLGIVEAKGLLRGKVAGVDSTYLRADASMKTIVRKDTGDDYAAYLKKLCEAQGIEDSDGGGRAPDGPYAQGEEDLQQGLEVSDGRRCTHRAAQGRPNAARLQGRARGGSRYRRGRGCRGLPR